MESCSYNYGGSCIIPDLLACKTRPSKSFGSAVNRQDSQKRVDCPKSQTTFSNGWLRESQKLITGLMQQTRAGDGETRRRRAAREGRRTEGSRPVC